MSKILTSLGLMSGTSLDGIDAAIIKTDGEEIHRTEHFLTIPYEDSLREKLFSVIKTQKNIEEVEKLLTEAHADAVKALLEKAGLSKDDIDVIGFHGQTIDHQPDKGITKQIGDGKLLAELTGINVVNDFRSADVKDGGQGAPLAPLYHQAILKEEAKPIAVLNIGGVANVTYVGRDELIAFDTGTGNAMLNDWVKKHTGDEFDEDGKYAAQGTVNQEVIKKLLKHPYFSKEPPKSLDRNDFSIDTLPEDISLEDGAATIVDFMVKSIIRSCQYYPEKPKKWYVCGGGRHNKLIMEKLSENLEDVQKIESLGLNGDAIEAEAFAFLAVRSLNKMPITLATTTGVKTPSATGGVFCPA